MIRVKICGITNLEDALLASSMGADALGFIFSKKSPRCIKKETAKKIIQELDPFVKTVGVFVDEEKEIVSDIAAELKLNVLQFHGKESAAYCNFFRKQYKVIKTIFPSALPLSKAIAAYNVDAFLFDVPYEDKKRGLKFLPQEVLKELKTFIGEGKRVILSGGLNPGNVGKIIKYNPYGVDVASGVEQLVGKKDPRKMGLFIEKVKGYAKQ